MKTESMKWAEPRYRRGVPRLRLRFGFLLGFTFFWAAASGQELTQGEALNLLRRISAVARRMESAHVILKRIPMANSSAIKIRGEAETVEVWSGPEKVHEIWTGQNREEFYDRFGHYTIEPTHRKLIADRAEFGPARPWIYPYDVFNRLDKDLHVSMDGQSYRFIWTFDQRIENGYRPQRIVTKDTIWTERELTPIRESTTTTFYPVASNHREAGRIAVYRSDRTFKVWQVSKGIKLLKPSPPIENEDKILSASFIPISDQRLTPNLFSSGLKIIDRRSPIPVEWYPDELVAANHDDPDIDTKRLLDLTRVRVQPLATKRHSEFRERLRTLSKAERFRGGVFYQLGTKMLQVAAAFVLLVAFFISARNALSPKVPGQR